MSALDKNLSKRQYPSKKQLNVVHKKKNTNATKKVLSGLLVLVLFLVFAKFGIWDVIAEKNEQVSLRNATNRELDAVKASNADYDEISEKYAHKNYNHLTQEEQVLRNRQSVFALVDQYIIPFAKVSEMELSGNVISYVMSDVSMNTLADILDRVLKLDEIKYANVYNATTGEKLEIAPDNTKAVTAKLDITLTPSENPYLTPQQKEVLPEEYVVKEGYEVLSYVDLNARKYVDTKYYCTPDTSIETEYQLLDNAGGSYVLSGNCNETDFRCGILYENGHLAYGFNDTDKGFTETSITPDTERHKAILNRFDSSFMFYDGAGDNRATAHLEGSASQVSTNHLIIGANNNSGNIENGAYVRVYVTRIYERNILIHQYVPCLEKETNKAGLYDTQANIFYPVTTEGKED